MCMAYFKYTNTKRNETYYKFLTISTNFRITKHIL